LAEERLVGVSDNHYPFHDPKAEATVLQLIEHIKPTTLAMLGDGFDFYQISRFLPDPGRRDKLGEDIEAWRMALREYRRAAGPDCEMVYFEGNHEHRLEKWRRLNPEMGSLACLSLESLFGLEEIGCRLVRGNQRFFFHEYALTHGDRVRKRAGATGQAMIDYWGTSGMSGHVHRLAQVHKRDAFRDFCWIETGCLCSLSPEYMAVADWQHGIAVVTKDSDGVWPEIVPIKDGVARRDGLTFYG
jgi:hypothetical protein